jgi:hypothetical protein
MSRDFYIKTGDTLPSISSTLYNDDGTPVNLSGTTVRFFFKKAETGTSKGGVAVLVDAANGQVRYDWKVGDTSEAGTHYAEWEVTFGSGAKATYPNSRYLLVEISEGLG